MGLSDGVLQSGARKREGRSGRRSGLLPAQSSGAGSAGGEFGRVELLLAGCRADEQRRIAGKPHTVGEAMGIEREHLLPLPAEGFELAEISFPVVDSKGCVKARTNCYSTPLKPGTQTRVKLLPAYVEVWQERECVARHERSSSRYEQVLDLEHYLDVLERKPGALNQTTQALEHASVRQYCKVLRMPVIGSNFVRLSEQAIKEQRSHIGYLEALLTMEAEERDRHAIQKRIRDAKLPRLKTLEEFDFNQAHQIPAAKIRELAEGGYIERAEPVVFMGECGTGKTHLATGLCVAACRQKRRARFTTAANLVNELVEARQQNAVKRVLVRWLRYDVIVLDEVGYVPLAEIGAEFLFQVIAERAERAALIVTTNLPFSEWTQVFSNPRLCKALLDRITDRAHIIETGTESYRFRRTLEVRQKKKVS